MGCTVISSGGDESDYNVDEGAMTMQGPRCYEPLHGLDGYEQMLNTFAENAKAYWRLWGPMGKPMVRVVDAWAEQQRSYLQWLRDNYGSGDHP